MQSKIFIKCYSNNKKLIYIELETKILETKILESKILEMKILETKILESHVSNKKRKKKEEKMGFFCEKYMMRSNNEIMR